jgi:hypothetical protein
VSSKWQEWFFSAILACAPFSAYLENDELESGQRMTTLKEKMNAEIPRFRYVWDLLPDPGQAVWLACSVPGGHAMFQAVRHPEIEGNPWYIQKESTFVAIGEEKPMYWFPLSESDAHS